MKHVGPGANVEVELELVELEVVEVEVLVVTDDPDICTVTGAVCIRTPLLAVTVRV